MNKDYSKYIESGKIGPISLDEELEPDKMTSIVFGIGAKSKKQTKKSLPYENG